MYCAAAVRTPAEAAHGARLEQEWRRQEGLRSEARDELDAARRQLTELENLEARGPAMQTEAEAALEGARAGAAQAESAQRAANARVALFHAAGIAHRAASPADYEACTHRATLALARRASAAGVHRFVFLSSVSAGPDAGPYGYWKWRTEEDLKSAYRDSPMEVVLVRPALVYGPGAKANLKLLIGAVRRGLPTPPAGRPRSMIGLPDLCEALCLMLDVDPGRGRVFFATDGEPYDLQRMHRAFCEALGRRPGRAWSPLWCWRLACNLLDALRRRRIGETFQQLFGGEEFSNAELCQAMSWQPRHRLEDLAAAMVESGS